MSFGLYLHFPFCRNKCSYCDFYKELHDHRLEREFYHALRIETEMAADDPSVQENEITTIFVGGGTPSLTSLDLFADWLSHLKRHIPIADKIEFTIECNPETVTLENLQVLKELGVNRPVFGIQSFNTGLLKQLDRRHNPHHSHQAVYFANVLDFRNFGVDLIFGLPGQTGKMLSADLDELLSLQPPHVSFYQLTVEEGTPLAERVKAGRVVLPDQELCLGLYRGGSEMMADEGYHRYEVSSFAREGHECRHNLGYWEGADFLGLGPSAHSFIRGQRFANPSNLTEYSEALKQGELPHVVDESGDEERMTEAIMLGLRTARGVNRARFSKRFGIPLSTRLDKRQLDALIESGHIIADDEGLRLSDDGVALADEITRRLLK